MHRFTWFVVGVLAAAGAACGAPRQVSVWSFRTDRPWLAGDSHALTPVVDRESVFFCGGYFWNDDDAIHALSLKDGRVAWRHRVGQCRSNPWLMAGTLIVHSQESRSAPCVFQGFDPATGTVRWRREFQKDVPVSISRCAIHDAAAGDTIVFAFDGEQDVQTVRAADGALARFTVSVERKEQRIWLAASGSNAWFGVGTHVWRWPAGRSQPDDATSLARDAASPWFATAIGTQVLLADREPGWARAFDLPSGRMRWEQTALPQVRTMSAGDGAFYLNVSRRQVELIALDVDTGTQRWAGVGGFNSPAMKDGWLYTTASDSVLVVDARTGQVARTLKAEAEVITTPVPAGDLLLFGTINGALHAVHLDELPRPARVAAISRAARIDSVRSP